MYSSVVGNNVLIIGDLHFSDVFKGKHKNYLENCCWVLSQISNKIKEAQPSAVVLLGDLVGWTETNIRDRQILSLFMKVLKEWNEYCPVYSLRGNHDIKGYPDFNLLVDMGLIITSEMCDGFFDYFSPDNDEIPEVRYHLVDYNSEHRTLDILDNNKTSNIVLAHNNFTISGVTNWYAQHDGLELAMMSNFAGVDFVIAGHIHNPSPEIVVTTIGEKTCMLFYPGCPTRPIKDQNMWESCWYMKIAYNKDTQSCDIVPEEFKLKPSKDLFFEDKDFIDDEDKTEDMIQDELRRENLKDILGDLMKYRMQGGDPYNQIDMIPHATPEAKAKAKEYLQKAFNNQAS